MTICRYFLQGYCRFGDRCRFEHTDPDSVYEEETPKRSNYNNRGSYNDGYNRKNYNAYDNRSSYNYDRRNEYTPHEDRYQTNYSQFNQRYSSERQYHSERYGSGTYEGDSSYSQANRFGQKKHEWVSDDYRRQRDQRRNTEEFYNTSTPKSKVNFSFKDPELQRTDHPVDLHMNEQNLLYLEIMKDDMKAWELGSQWPFTCYSPVQERSSFPGFTDVSPEELRYEAYKARDNNTYDSYVESVEKELQNINNRRNELKNPSVQMMSIIEKYRLGQDVGAESEVDGVLLLSRSNQSPIENMLADELSLQQQNAAASFSFKLPPESGSSLKFGSAASSFSFRLPSETKSKPISHAMNSEIYTPLERLSSADKEQFTASTFTLGKIPTLPPPQEMCF